MSQLPSQRQALACWLLAYRLSLFMPTRNWVDLYSIFEKYRALQDEIFVMLFVQSGSDTEGIERLKSALSNSGETDPVFTESCWEWLDLNDIVFMIWDGNFSYTERSVAQSQMEIQNAVGDKWFNVCHPDSFSTPEFTKQYYDVVMKDPLLTFYLTRTEKDIEELATTTDSLGVVAERLKEASRSGFHSAYSLWVSIRHLDKTPGSE